MNIIQISEVLKHKYNQTSFKELVSQAFKLSTYDSEDTLSYDQQDVIDKYTTNRNGLQASIKSAKIIGHGEVFDNEYGDVFKCILVDIELNGSKRRVLSNTDDKRNFVSELIQASESDIAIVVYHSSNSDIWRISYIENITTGSSDGDSKTVAYKYNYNVGVGESVRNYAGRLNHLCECRSVDRFQIKDAMESKNIGEEFFSRCDKIISAIVNSFKEDEATALMERRRISSDPVTKSEALSIIADNTELMEKYGLMGDCVVLSTMLIYFMQKNDLFKSKTYMQDIFNDYNNSTENNGISFYDRKLAPVIKKEILEGNLSKIDLSDIYTSKSYEELFNGELKIIDAWFSNSNNDGLLDIIEAYGISLSDENVFDKDLAVRVDFFGKLLEKIAGTAARKAAGELAKDGVYYTNEGVVNKQVSTALIEYLAVNTEKSIESVLGLLSKCDKYMAENALYNLDGDEAYRLIAIDKLLANVRLIDIMVGSGVYLVSAVNTIAKWRNTITPSFIASKLATMGERSIFKLKLHAINNSVYGIEILNRLTVMCRVNLASTAIIDFDTAVDDNSKIEFKHIIKADSLLGNIEFYKKSTIGYDINTFAPEVVSRDNPGFDICIGNPPYIRGGDIDKSYRTKRYKLNGSDEERSVECVKDKLSGLYPLFTKSGDYLIAAYNKWYNLLRDKGILSIIISDKWMTADYGKKMREHMLKNMGDTHIMSYGNTAFPGVGVDTCVVHSIKNNDTKTNMCGSIKYINLAGNK